LVAAPQCECAIATAAASAIFARDGRADRDPHTTETRADMSTSRQSVTAQEPAAEQPIRLYGPDAFAGMRKAGQLAAQALDLLYPLVVPGVTTEALDDRIYQFAIDNNATPAPLFYRGYPKSICTSVNHVVCHGIPSNKRLREGDILNIDVTLIVDGWHGDSSRMYTVGAINRRAQRLIDVTYEALMRGIAAVKPGNTTGDIGFAIQRYAEGERCSVVRDFCGHGLAQVFHERPNILHYGERGEGPVLEAGMLFTIEPMINLGKPDVRMLLDGWTAVTRDKELSAQFEHTVGVTAMGCEIFTLSPANLHKPPI
jgi:methionyl aminopeptidase